MTSTLRIQMFLIVLFFIVACQPEKDAGVFEATPVEGRKMILILLDGTASDDTVYVVDIDGAESFTGRANQSELWLDYEGVQPEARVSNISLTHIVRVMYGLVSKNEFGNFVISPAARELEVSLKVGETTTIKF